MLSETCSQRYLNRGCEPSPDECAGDYFSSLLDSIYSRLMARINDPRDGAWATISNADLVHMWFESLNRARAYGSRCLLYTSDAADDLLCVDLGGRRIIKKKKK